LVNVERRNQTIEEILADIDLTNIENHCILSDLEDEEDDNSSDMPPHLKGSQARVM